MHHYPRPYISFLFSPLFYSTILQSQYMPVYDTMKVVEQHNVQIAVRKQEYQLKVIKIIFVESSNTDHEPPAK